MQLIKKIIKKFFHKFGYELTRYDLVRDDTFNLLEFVLKDIILKTPDFFFVQVGANDGKMGDPLCDLIKKYKLKGLLIEPLPEEFKLLCKITMIKTSLPLRIAQFLKKSEKEFYTGLEKILKFLIGHSGWPVLINLIY